jgi:hypothetical protein
MPKQNDWFWMRRSGDAMDALEIPPTGDVVIREPQEGWSRAFYEAVVRRYLAVRVPRRRPHACIPARRSR